MIGHSDCLRTLLQRTGVMIGVFSISATYAFAAGLPPTGGDTLRNIERTTPTPPLSSPDGAKIEIPDAPALSSVQRNGRVPVKGYRLTGNTVFEEATLLALVADRTGTLSLDELKEVTDTLASYYRDQGYLLTVAYLPEQEIENGIVTIAVLEGRYDQINIDNKARLNDKRVQRILTQAICETDNCSGALIQRQALERGLLLLNDTPGAYGIARLSPGQQVGTSQLDVGIDPDPLVIGGLQLDNLGNYYTGRTRAIGTLQLNSPWGIGDQLTLQGVASTGHGDIQYGMLDYGLPIGYSGMRINARGSYLQYDLGGSYEDLDAHGTVKSGDLALTYPFIRRLNGNLYGNLSYGIRKFHDEIDAVDTETERRISNRLELGLAGDVRDTFFGSPALNTLSLLYTRGELEFDDAISEFVDSVTARSEGDYGKWTLSYSRLQSLFQRSSLYLRASAQGTSDNLDSYEKFALGGPYSVRAYPAGDTLADKAILFSVEWRQQIPVAWGDGLEGIVFYDRARGTLDADPWTNSDNHVTLDGAGVGLNFRISHKTVLSSTLAFRGNRDMTAAPDRHYQFNLSLSTAF